mmetsp:Transcript_13883/g.47984  ORF Transcript_13883/g.47984 Transcript_13883/m.47984 type:complete len:89 (-) Transcript_13883:1014-1280(-)
MTHKMTSRPFFCIHLGYRPSHKHLLIDGDALPVLIEILPLVLHFFQSLLHGGHTFCNFYLTNNEILQVFAKPQMLSLSLAYRFLRLLV